MWKYITEYSELVEVLPNIMSEPVISIDVETRGLDPFIDELLLVQIGTSNMVYIFDARLLDLTPLTATIKDYTGITVFHNGKFDCKYLRLKYGYLPKNAFDTMLAQALIHAGIGAPMTSLNYLSTRYLDRPLVKEIRDSFAESTAFFTDQQLNYAADDARTTLDLYPILSRNLAKQSLESVADLEFKVLNVVVDMELRGIGFNREVWKRCNDKSVDDYAKAKEGLHALLSSIDSIDVEAKSKGVAYTKTIAGKDINLNSHVQLLSVFNKFGINVPDTSAETLSLVEDHPLVAQLLRYRKFAKRLSTYGENFFEYIHSVTGRVHPEFNQIGTDTGRWSSSNPNAQNIPNPKRDKEAPNYREAFVSSNGYSFVVSDYSQVELRILAEVSQEPRLIQAYLDGADIHTLTATLMYHVIAEEVQEDQRSVAKNTNFAMAYGSGAGNLSRKFHIPLAEAQVLVDNFHKGYPVLTSFLSSSGQQSVINHYAKTILGRRRNFELPSYNSPDFKRIISAIRREGTNHIIQGTSADMTKLAMWYIYKDIGQLGGHLEMTVHDEVVAEFPDDTVNDGKRLIEESMIKAGEQLVKSVPILADAKVSKCWSK